MEKDAVADFFSSFLWKNGEIAVPRLTAEMKISKIDLFFLKRDFEPALFFSFRSRRVRRFFSPENLSAPSVEKSGFSLGLEDIVFPPPIMHHGGGSLALEPSATPLASPVRSRPFSAWCESRFFLFSFAGGHDDNRQAVPPFPPRPDLLGSEAFSCKEICCRDPNEGNPPMLSSSRESPLFPFAWDHAGDALLTIRSLPIESFFLSESLWSTSPFAQTFPMSLFPTFHTRPAPCFYIGVPPKFGEM